MKKPVQARGPALPGDRGFLVPWLGVAVVLCVPIWLPSLPPLSDLYNHLARIHILAHRDEIAAHAAYYGEDWGVMPNLALDLVGLPLLAVFDLATVAKLFLTLTVLLWHAGCTYLGRVLCGRVPRRALVCAFFVYNQQFLHGYVNFSFGMGLALVTLALWLAWRERLATWRIAPLTALGAAVFLAHLSAFATLAREGNALLAVALGLFTARTAVTAAHWIDLDREFQDHLEAFAAIEEGAALHNIYFYPTGRLFNATRVRGLALIHTPAFAAVTRHALVPTLYGLPGQQPLVHRVPMYRSHRFHDGQRPTIAWDRIFGHYHYVWTCRAPADLIAPLVERGRLRARAGACALYQLDAPGALPVPAAGAGGH